MEMDRSLKCREELRRIQSEPETGLDIGKMIIDKKVEQNQTDKNKVDGVGS